MGNIRNITATLGMKGDGSSKLARFGLAVDGVKAGLDILVGTFKIVKTVVFDFTNDLAKQGDELAKTASKIGLSTEALQEISFAAEISGADVTKVTKAVQTMAKGLNDARNKGTGPFVDSIKQLGIGIEEFDGLSPDEVFERFADEIQKIEDPITQSAIAADVFGRSGKELLPFFKEGGEGIRALRKEFKELGGGFTNDGARAAEEFIDSQTRLGVVIDSIKIAIGTELFPVIQGIVDRIREWFLANKELVKARIIGFIKDLTAKLSTMAPLLEKVVSLAEKWIPILVDLAEAAINFFGTLDEGEVKVALVAAAFVALGLAIGGIPGLVIAAGGAIGVFAGNALADLTGLNEEIRRTQALIDKTKKETKKTTRGTGAAKDLRSASADELAALSEEEFESKVSDLIVATASDPALAGGAQDIIEFADKKRALGKTFAEEAAFNARLDALVESDKREKIRRRGKRGKKKGKGKVKVVEEEPLSDAELLQLVQKAGASGESLTGLIGDRKIPGGIPPVITITINNFEQDIDVAIESNVTGVPGSIAEEVAAVSVEQMGDMLTQEFESVKDTLAPPQQI